MVKPQLPRQSSAPQPSSLILATALAHGAKQRGLKHITLGHALHPTYIYVYTYLFIHFFILFIGLCIWALRTGPRFGDSAHLDQASDESTPNQGDCGCCCHHRPADAASSCFAQGCGKQCREEAMLKPTSLARTSLLVDMTIKQRPCISCSEVNRQCAGLLGASVRKRCFSGLQDPTP